VAPASAFNPRPSPEGLFYFHPVHFLLDTTSKKSYICTVTVRQQQAEDMTMPAAFEIGKTYVFRSVCDHGCIWHYQAVARTGKTVDFRDAADGRIHRLRVSGKLSQGAGEEIVFPFGRASMSPTLRASNTALKLCK
jgi:hypothetical protein